MRRRRGGALWSSEWLGAHNSSRARTDVFTSLHGRTSSGNRSSSATRRSSSSLCAGVREKTFASATMLAKSPRLTQVDHQRSACRYPVTLPKQSYAPHGGTLAPGTDGTRRAIRGHTRCRPIVQPVWSRTMAQVARDMTSDRTLREPFDPHGAARLGASGAVPCRPHRRVVQGLRPHRGRLDGGGAERNDPVDHRHDSLCRRGSRLVPRTGQLDSASGEVDPSTGAFQVFASGLRCTSSPTSSRTGKRADARLEWRSTGAAR